MSSSRLQPCIQHSLGVSVVQCSGCCWWSAAKPALQSARVLFVSTALMSRAGRGGGRMALVFFPFHFSLLFTRPFSLRCGCIHSAHPPHTFLAAHPSRRCHCKLRRTDCLLNTATAARHSTASTIGASTRLAARPLLTDQRNAAQCSQRPSLSSFFSARPFHPSFPPLLSPICIEQQRGWARVAARRLRPTRRRTSARTADRRPTRRRSRSPYGAGHHATIMPQRTLPLLLQIMPLRIMLPPLQPLPISRRCRR